MEKSADEIEVLQLKNFLCSPVHYGMLEASEGPELVGKEAISTLPLTEEELQDPDHPDSTSSWRPRERMKTVNVALVMCLNLGTDPPDTIKTSPCAKLECWFDPTSVPNRQTNKQQYDKALETIGTNLQQQYEKLQPRARYKQCLDPTSDDMKKLCLSMRRTAKNDRVLIHYNGHGVPHPTANGEIWVFNQNFTQYIPLSVYDLRWWTGTPSVYVLDCSMAGILLPHFLQVLPGDGSPPPDLSNLSLSSFQSFSSSMSLSALEKGPGANDCIVLAPCGAQESLPVNPYFPADIFTSCLTTPIPMALRWFVFENRLSMKDVDPREVEELPGKLSDRKTLLGELNWIFTAITDTIAWNALPGNLFQKLFRQDLLLASLFRNFLLADRVLRSLSCTPFGIPPLPPAYNHPLWQAWDMAVECCLIQVRQRLNPNPLNGGNTSPALQQNASSSSHAVIPFFVEQLTAFEIWLEFADSTASIRQPEQLPVVLQVLLSQSHRPRALGLLQRFLDLGSWAVNLALSVGIFPYVLKLLQAPTADLRQVLVSIWARIIAYDKGVQVDLVKENAYVYFISHLTLPDTTIEQRVKVAFILTAIIDKNPAGRDACLQHSLHKSCTKMLESPESFGCQGDRSGKNLGHRFQAWLCLCMAKMCTNSSHGQTAIQRDGAYVQLLRCLISDAVEVRCAATYALGTLFTSDESQEELVEEWKQRTDLSIAMEVLRCSGDCNPLVRREAVLSLTTLVLNPLHFLEFVRVSQELMRLQKANESPTTSSVGRSDGTAINQSQDYEEERAASFPATLTQILSQRLEPQLGQFSQAYVRVWLSLRNLQHCDPYSLVVEAASHIIQVVEDYMLKIAKSPEELFFENRSYGEQAYYTTPIHELYPPPTLERPRGFYSQGSGTPGRRESSGSMMSDGPGGNGSRSLTWLQDQYANPFFYNWMCQPFRERVSATGLSEEESRLDPLCFAGAISSYNSQRNYRCQFEAALLVQACGEILHNQTTADQVLHAAKGKSGSHSSQSPLQNFLHLEQAQILESDSATTSLLLFHSFEPLLVVADDKDQFSLWAFEEGKKLLTFSNGNKGESRLSTCLWVNEGSTPLLIAGSNDGIVRIWGGLLDCLTAVGEEGMCPSSLSPYLLTAFHMAPDLWIGEGAANLVSTWNQESGYLISGGNSASIRVLDLAIERFVMNWHSVPDNWVTALADYPHKSGTPPGLAVAGYSNGSIRLFDIRMQNAVLSTTEHEHGIINTTYIKEGTELVSADVAGGLCLWDVRQTGTPLFRLQNSLEVHPPTGHERERASVSAFAVHRSLPILASGSHSQFIKTFSLEGETLGVIRYHDGFLGQRIGPVSFLAFHPLRLLLAAGATDSIISIYSGLHK